MSFQEFLILRNHRPSSIDSILVLNGLAGKINGGTLKNEAFSFHQVWFELPGKTGEEIQDTAKKSVDQWPSVNVKILPPSETSVYLPPPAAANNWARGYHVEGERIIDQVMNVVDATVDKTESLQGFIITHSIGGGCGSLIVEKLREAYPKRKIFTFSVAPSALISDSATEAYNSILSLQKLKENADATILRDSEALFRIAQSKLKRSPNYMDVNHMTSLIMSSVTSSLRFHGTLNTDLGECLVNLVPFTGDHFLTASFAPMTPTKPDGIVRTEFADLAAETFSRNNFSAEIDFDAGVFLSACALFRGDISAKSVDEKVSEIRKSLKFASYVPTGIKIGIIDTAPEGFGSTGLALVNHTGISQVFKRRVEQFDIIFENEAYTHWYQNNCVSLERLEEARNVVADLAKSYDDGAA